MRGIGMNRLIEAGKFTFLFFAASLSLATTTYAESPDDWPIHSPEAVGLSSERLKQAADDARSAAFRYCFTVIKDGALVYDRNYFGNANQSFTAYSVTKTIAAIVVGIAQYDGYLSLDDKVTDWLEDLPAAMNPDATIRHVLGQVSESSSLGEGSGFSYNSGEVINTLGIILSRATGMSSADYAQQVLFNRLNMNDSEWATDNDSNILIGYGARSSCRDIARVGQLMLNGGVWEGQRLLDENYITEMTRPSYPSANSNYGYLTWLNQSNGTWHRPLVSGDDIMVRGAPRNAYFATGFFGQLIIIVPDDNIVVTSMGWTPNLETLNTLQKVWDAVQPALPTTPAE